MPAKQTIHIPVLLGEVIQHLDIQANGTYIDATFGGGGHSRAILSRLGPAGTLLALDLNPQAVESGLPMVLEAQRNGWGQLILRQSNFSDLARIAAEEGLGEISGILFDLGLSSDLLASERGFSFDDENLDMVFASEGEFNATDLINLSDEQDLVYIFSKFGEERYSRRIAKAIVLARQASPISSASQLKEIIVGAVPDTQFTHKSVVRIFQSLRIVINSEFQNLSQALKASGDLLRAGGRLAVISFHSLEDRLVKNFFRLKSGHCNCFKPPELCRCDIESVFKVITRKPVLPTDIEVKENPRSRSAKLRVVEKIAK